MKMDEQIYNEAKDFIRSLAEEIDMTTEATLQKVLTKQWAT